MSDRPDGVLSAARLALAIRRFREATPDGEIPSADPIAVIGIGCRLPGDIRSPEDCWRILSRGIDTVTEVPAGRWPVEDYYDADPMAAGKTNGRWGGFVSDPDLFDPVLFGISPREAVNIDPQQRLLLEVAWEAIQDSGRAPESLAGSKAGVFVGISLSDYEHLAFEDAYAINSNSCTGA
jgi:acyl transferase domain-containing protein